MALKLKKKTQKYVKFSKYYYSLQNPYLHLPSQPQLVLIYRPRRDGRLSRPWCEITQAEIRTCNLPIANPALYHTATSTPIVYCVVINELSIATLSYWYVLLTYCFTTHLLLL